MATVWGGSSGPFLNTGARLNLSTLSWQNIAIPAGFRGRDSHVAVQVGSFMVIWGGKDNVGKIGDGSLYNSVTDTWTDLTLPDPPTPRSGAVGQWAGDRLIIWGGASAVGTEGSGKQLIIQTSPIVAPTEWRPMASLNAPSPRTDHTAVWTGTRIIIWGGKIGANKLGDGAIYDPATDSWTPLAATGAPSPRGGHTAIWTGMEMIIHGGETATSGATATGGAYDPTNNTWRPLSTSGNPTARTGATAIWTGTDMIVFGGQSATSQPLAALQRLSPLPEWHLYRKF